MTHPITASPISSNNAGIWRNALVTSSGVGRAIGRGTTALRLSVSRDRSKRSRNLMRSLSVRPIGCTAARMGRRKGGREEDGLQVEGETREERGAEGEKIGTATTRKRQQVRRAAYRHFRLKIALTQKLRCYFWKSAERGGRDRAKEGSGQDSSRRLVGPTHRPSFARRGCLLETDTLTVGRTKRSVVGVRARATSNEAVGPSRPE